MNDKREGTGNRSLLWFVSLSLLAAVILAAMGYSHRSAVADSDANQVATSVDIEAVLGGAGNSKLTSSRNVRVTIFGSSSFDVTTLVSKSLSFKDAITHQGAAIPIGVSVSNVNPDSYPDLIAEFALESISEQPTKMVLEGRTDSGVLVLGSACLQASGEPCGGTVLNAGESKQPIQSGPTGLAVECVENFDAATPPAFPTGWVVTTAIDCVNSNPWENSNAGTPSPAADSLPNAAFVNDPNCISDERLDSPGFPVVSTTATLTFRQNRNLENGFDGGVLELSTNAGATFQDALAAGATFGVGGYNGTISVNFGSPIAGRQAWTGNSAGFVTTTVNFPAAFNGQTVVLRFRRATDSSVSGQGWRIDSITSTGTDCSGAACMLTCPANVAVSNDPNQCGAVVNYPPPTSAGSCGTITCSPPSGSFFPVGTTTVTCTASLGGATCTFTVTVNDTQPPTITCPANVTQSNDPNQCGAVVKYPPATASDNCPGVGTPLCSPATGSFFPVGVTTVTCSVADAAGNTATCTFTITVVDTQPPTITCPANQTGVTDQTTCASAGCQAVTFPDPVATDNCPGVTVACVPPSGTCFPVGVTTVTCTATDVAGNTATCSFTVTVFDVVLQDDSDPTIVLLWNSLTGQYRFCCKGAVFAGFGKSQVQGCIFTLTHSPAGLRVIGRVDKTAHAGTASVQAPPGTLRCTIFDRDIRNDVPLCQ